MVSGKHSICSHFPKDRNCEIHKRTNITRDPCRRRTGKAIPRAESFGDLITADHKVLSEGFESRNSPIRSRRTRFGYSMFANVSVLNKNLTGNGKEFAECLWPIRKAESHLHCQIPWDLAKRVKNYPGSIVRQHLIVRKQIASLKERCAESRTELLLQSGLDETWWADSLECYCHLRHVQDLLSDRKPPDELRFGEPFTRPVIPVGSMIEYHLISVKDLSRIHRLGKKVLPRIFLGCALSAGDSRKVAFWS